MNVLSLFDGIGVARLALDELGITPNYYASEINQDCIEVVAQHYPDVVQLGNIEDIKWQFLPKIDLIIGGSPCQFLSVRRKGKRSFAGSSSLFHMFCYAIEVLKPDHFLLENVASMGRENQDKISKALKVEPVKINSSLVSGQNRERLYWGNFPITIPKDENILLQEVLESGYTDRTKSYCLTASYDKVSAINYLVKNERQMVWTCQPKILGDKVFIDGEVYKKDDYESLKVFLRKLTHVEAERLQTLPDNYTLSIASNRERFRAIGNAFTCDVVKHILMGGGLSRVGAV